MDEKTVNLAVQRLLQQINMRFAEGALFVKTVVSTTERTFKELKLKINLEFFDVLYVKNARARRSVRVQRLRHESPTKVHMPCWECKNSYRCTHSLARA